MAIKKQRTLPSYKKEITSLKLQRYLRKYGKTYCSKNLIFCQPRDKELGFIISYNKVTNYSYITIHLPTKVKNDFTLKNKNSIKVDLFIKAEFISELIDKLKKHSLL